MAKTPARKPKTLKVFRTPIGFHDAYVAAPSQKAALEAWGSDVNLFARGAAEQVTDPALMEEPLAHPGEVIRRLRGSEAEQVAALDSAGAKKKGAPSSRSPSASRPLPRGERVRGPKPDLAELDAAEERLAKLEKEQKADQRKIEDDIERLERERRDMLRRHERERDELAEQRDRARAAYERAIRRWKKG